MPTNIRAREWLLKNGYDDVAALIDTLTNSWKIKGVKTRRNWWDVLAGGKNGTPRIIGGIAFPVLRAAQVRKEVPITSNAICRNESEQIPPITHNGRWPKKNSS